MRTMQGRWGAMARAAAWMPAMHRLLVPGGAVTRTTRTGRPCAEALAAKAEVVTGAAEMVELGAVTHDAMLMRVCPGDDVAGANATETSEP